MDSIPKTTSKEPTGKYQLFDPLTPEEYDALKASIMTYGIQSPIIKDREGNILEGHHRAQIAAEVGKECPVEVRDFPNEQEKRDFVRSINMARRTLEPHQKRAVIVAQLHETPDYSDYRISRLLGVGQHTVERIHNSLIGSGELPDRSHVPNALGYERPTTYQKDQTTELPQEELISHRLITDRFTRTSPAVPPAETPLKMQIIPAAPKPNRLVILPEYQRAARIMEASLRGLTPDDWSGQAEAALDVVQRLIAAMRKA